MRADPTRIDRLAALLHETGETHHVVWRITDGDDPDRASWYADWQGFDARGPAERFGA